jgi:hypothetical protein
MRYPLIGGAYAPRSPIANSQRCINLYPENNRKDSPVAVTHYQRPGNRPLAQGPAAPVRCLYRASNGNGYCVIGPNVYSISPTWVLTQIGAVPFPPAGGSAPSYPCSMTDNGIAGGQTILLVDGSPLGYSINMKTNAFSQVVDATGTFQGARRVDVIDGFILWGFIDGSNNFGSTTLNSLTFNALYIAGKNDYPDPLAGLVVSRHEILLLGQVKGEIWYDAGNPLFPFAELPGAFIEHGVVAPYSICREDINVYWLGQDLEGQGVVFRQRGYETKRVSNHAIEYAIRQMAATGTIADCITYCHQLDGHVFVVFNFPTGDQTWVFDSSMVDPTLAWHQRGWTDVNGALHRDRGNCGAFINSQNVIGDWQNGTIYALDPSYYQDNINGQIAPIHFIRTFPQIYEGADERGQPQLADGKVVQINGFVADIEGGYGDGTGAAGQISLRASFDRGISFQDLPLQTTGTPGEYITSPKWGPIGSGRWPVLELHYSFAAPAALNGGWVDARIFKK